MTFGKLFGAAAGDIIGSIFVAACLFFFAFSTIISWNFFGKVNVEYLAKKNRIATLIYSVVAIAFIFLGTTLKNDLVWELTDFFNYLMVLPNAIALFALSKLVKKNALDK
jgi:AGCS family alanine or glycine:cation symporter